MTGVTRRRHRRPSDPMEIDAKEFEKMRPENIPVRHEPSGRINRSRDRAMVW